MDKKIEAGIIDNKNIVLVSIFYPPIMISPQEARALATQILALVQDIETN